QPCDRCTKASRGHLAKCGAAHGPCAGSDGTPANQYEFAGIGYRVPRGPGPLFGRNCSLIIHLLVMPVPPKIKRAALLRLWDRLTLCRLGMLRGVVRHGLVKCHLGVVGVRLTSGACIVTAFTAQAGFRKDPVAIAFLCLSLRFGLLLLSACSEHGLMLFLCDLFRRRTGAEPLSRLGDHAVGSVRAATNDDRTIDG